ncbi:MAG TPA: DUF1326 domain-containing protein [Chloroflexota bacterium]|nr:DUF1326 domain-containing protein [Chloroflexota bacterium]
MMTTETATTWSLKGTVVLACNCEPGCPCNFNALPTHGDCEGGWSWTIEEGEYGGVQLGGLSFALCADWPGAIHEGNGQAVTFIDERADGRQRAALDTLLRGGVGGPWAILRNTISRYEGPHYVPYHVSVQDFHSSVHAGDRLQLELEPIKNPVSGAETHPRIVLPEGFVWQDGGTARSGVFTVQDSTVSYDHSGRYAAYAPFEYRGP